MLENSQLKDLQSSLRGFPKEVKEHFTGLLTISPFHLIIIDSDFCIIFASQMICQKTGYSLSGLVGKAIKTIIPEALQVLKRFNSQKKISDKFEIKPLTLKTLDGKELSGTAIISRYERKNTKLYTLIFTKIEILKELDILHETIHSGNFFNQITGRGQWILNYDTGQFIGNPQCFLLLGIKARNGSVPLAEVLNAIGSVEERDNFEKEIIRLEQDPSLLTREFRLKSEFSDGNNYKYLRITMQRPGTTKKKILAGTIDDISSFKKTEKELIKSRARMEKADRFKSVFLANMSHEIRTPMNSILGYSELLNQPGLSSKEVSEYTSIIRSKGNYLLALIDDAIELSRFESGNIEFRYTEFKLLPLLNDLYTEFDKRRIDKGKTSIELLLDVPEDSDDQLIYTDYGRLHQVLANLLSNALKFTEKGEIVFGYKLSSKFFKFFVSDTGVGLAKEDESKIFQRFEVLEETSIRRLSGTGLSLTISKHIVEQLGGRIKVRSALNEGSRFQLNIPIINPAKKKPFTSEESETMLSLNWKDKVILIGEDEDINFRFLEAVLQKTQAQILRAKNGQEAVDLCRKINKIDLVLLDIKMPVMSGYDAAIEIKKYRTNLPIIAQTAFSSQDEIVKCQQVGCDDYITKPIDINVLIEKINSYFRR